MKNLLKIFVLAAFFMAPGAADAGWAGKNAPGFTLPAINGEEVSLADYRGRVVFLDFWASWCSPCKKELPELNAFLERYEGEPVVVLAVNVDKVRSHAEDFLAGLGGLDSDMVVVFDPAGGVISKYNALAMPTSFIIDAEGVVRYVHYGYNEGDPEKWNTEIDGLLEKLDGGGGGE